MTERPEDRARRTAVTVGDEVEHLAARIVDCIEDLSLLVMERVADASPRSTAVSELRRAMTTLRRLAAPMPRIAGRIAAGTYFGVQMAVELYRTTEHGWDEGAASAAADGTDQEP
ncbi:MAG TPA: hypothetical protein VK587_09580 [bacterium]|nr:hypothetical protein [bacterium]